MKVLIYGSGAREHALAQKIKQSPLLEKLYLCNPNDGFAEIGEVLDSSNSWLPAINGVSDGQSPPSSLCGQSAFEELAQISREKGIDLLVVGPEDALINGIVDEFKKAGIRSIGPDKKWAMLEGSKSFAKEFMLRNNISTAKYEIITDINDIYNVLDEFNIPVVLKADGLAAGKGVYIAKSRLEAERTLSEYLEGKFNEASRKVVVEEFLEGEELSLIAMWDGNRLLPFIPARDYKKLKENNEGPNTGGMGAYCPVSLSADEYRQIEEYTDKLENALQKENANFTGVVYSGLIMTNQGLKALEYNMRFGDPETQALLMHLDTDLLELFRMTADKELDKANVKWKSGQSFCVVVAAEGYPENPVKGGEIKNIEQIAQKYGVNIFFAGVKKEGNSLLANGGRVLSVCRSGSHAQKHIYEAIEELDYKDKIYRKDIGEVNFYKQECEKNERSCNNCGI